MIRYNKISIWW